MGEKFYVLQVNILNNHSEIIELKSTNINDAYDEMEEVAGNSTRDILLNEKMLDNIVYNGLKLIEKEDK